VIRYATDAYLRFKDEYVGPALTGDKSVTVRYGLERSGVPGDQIALIDEDDDTFAEADVEASLDMPISRVCDFGIGPHEATDESVAGLLVDMDLAEIDRELTELREIDTALQRMREDTYGTCRDCGREIPVERLEAYPTAFSITMMIAAIAPIDRWMPRPVMTIVTAMPTIMYSEASRRMIIRLPIRK
jgi:hypothetical protein